MLDLHPLTEEQVEAEGRPIGVIADPEFTGGGLDNAEACLAEAIQEGLYRLEAEIEFDVLQHIDEAEELLEAREERLEASQPELAHRIRAATPPIVIREHVVFRRLRKESPT
jgi:hypothetical protein